MSGAMMVSVGTFASAGGGLLPFDFIGPPQLVSASFNGSSQSFQIATNAAFTYGTGDFTIEWWGYQTATSGVQGIWRNSTGDAANSIGFWTIAQPAGRITITIGNGVSGDVVRSNSAITTSTWNHYAFVRSGTLFTLYVNGVAQTETLNSSIDLPAQLAYMQIGNAGGLYAGRISNFRIVKGTAVYTTDFTPPTKPLQPITNTVLLVSMGVSPFVDSSTNAITITNVGTVATTASSPFSANWVDSISGIVATVGIGGTGQPTYDAKYGGGINVESAVKPYVDVPTTRTGEGGYTISMLANVPTVAGGYVPFYTGNNLYPTGGRTGNYIYARKWTNFEVGSFASANTTVNLNFPTGALTNPPAWFDFVYNGTAVSVYRNGLPIVNHTMSASAGWLNPLRFAADENAVQGAAFANTMATGTLYRMKHQLTALSAAQVTTQFDSVRTTMGGGTLAGSLSFPGGASGSNMLVLGTPPTIGAGSYTIECWFRSPNFDAGYGLCGAIATGGLSVYVANSTTITTDKYGGGGAFSYTVPTMTANTWYHFVLVRSSTTSAVFLNGVRAGVTQTDSLNYNGTTPHIGSYYGGCWPGLMTNFRIVVGTAVYTPTFGFCTPPIGPLTSITNTKYLMLGAATTTDTSGITAVTVTGAVTTSATKPF
jgi:hypothetical protein